MKCVEEGHVYKLDNFQTSPAQELVFLKRTNGELVYDGTTNEEVLEMLIDRIRHLNTKLSCSENLIALIRLEEALMWLNRRTELRNRQGVKTLDKAHKS